MAAKGPEKGVAFPIDAKGKDSFAVYAEQVVDNNVFRQVSAAQVWLGVL